MSSSPIIALDVGGSSVKSGIVTASGDVETIKSTPLDSKGSSDHILGTLANIVQSYLSEYDAVQGVGIGFPSPFDYDNGICLIEGVDKYEAIFNVDIGAAIREQVNHPDLAIRFRNDAEAALVGEALYGAGQPFSRFIGLTLGTGIGSSFIDTGKRVKSGEGIPEGGFLFPVEFRGKQADDWFGTRGLLARFDNAGISFPTVAEAAKSAENHPAVQDAFTDYGTDLASFVHPFLESFHAEALLISGGIANAYDLFGKALEAGVRVPVVRGKLGTKAALLGAADLILRDS